MSADQFGIDPNTGQPMQMQQGPPQGPPDQPQVDPNSPPADPMLGGPTSGDPMAEVDLTEFETRERVELGVLLTIEVLAKASRVGAGASDPDFVQKFSLAGDGWGRVYTALTGAEQKDTDETTQPPPPQSGGLAPVPDQGQAA